MRLLTLRDDESLALTKDLVDVIPPYAILSHTWGSDDDEVTFRDVTEGIGCDKIGYEKIRLCGKQAVSDGIEHFWVDTCCIDKSNNSELSEALNSMFRWYQNAQKCYVYLSDVTHLDEEEHEHLPQSSSSLAFRQSRWFTRGWTLQELIAPSVVEFFSSQWQPLGDKETLGQQIYEVTGIPTRVLQGSPLSEITVDERMSWSSRRATKRAEDMAYCLMGIFNIFLPLIYGEGRDHAILRLKQEIDERQRRARKQTVVDRPFDHTVSSELVENTTNTTQNAPKVMGQKLDSIENLLRSRLGLGRFFNQIESSIGFHNLFNNQTHDLFGGISTRQYQPTANMAQTTTYENQGDLVSRSSEENGPRMQSLRQPAPASAFERGPSFTPELYLINHTVPKLFCYASQQEQRLDYSVVYRLEIMYWSAPREWKRVTISTTMTFETPYWRALNAPLNTSLKLLRVPIYLPARLLSTIEKTLVSAIVSSQDTHISLYLGGQSLWYQSEPLTRFETPTSEEKDIDSRPLDPSCPTLYFVSFIKPRWVLDVRIGSLPAGINSAAYELQVLQTLRNVPGIVPLVGVILDTETKAIKSYLLEMPAQRQVLALVSRVYESGDSIAWDRREKWCRQLVQAVAKFHAKGFVIGVLKELLKDGVGLDRFDNVVLYRFRTNFQYGNTMIDLPPPEYRCSTLAQGSGFLPAVFETDIYQLGALLWRIALPAVGAEMNSFLTRAGYAEKLPKETIGYTLYTADLPVGDHMPQYLQDIITACRAESPDQRPPARKLLGMFPFQKHNSEPATPSQRKEPNKTENFTSTQLQGYPTKLEQIYESWQTFLCRCDRCGDDTVEHRFHCNVCSSGDFDLCLKCMDKGLHCLDDKHYLFEVPGSKERDVFYSSADQEGHRNTITI